MTICLTRETPNPGQGPGQAVVGDVRYEANHLFGG